MSLTKIEWCDHSINPIRGLCKFGCSYCYVRPIYRRFKLDTAIQLQLSAIDSVPKKKPSFVFVCSTHEIMGNWIPDEWINQIIERISQFPQHTYLFLSKNPMRYREFTWPDNAKLGMSITNSKDIKYFPFLNFISFEPLLDDIAQFPLPPKVQWYIVGGLTPKPIHEQKWIDGIVAQADEAGIPVFIKENAHYSKIRQDFPLWNGRTEEGGT